MVTSLLVSKSDRNIYYLETLRFFGLQRNKDNTMHQKKPLIYSEDNPEVPNLILT